MIWLSWRQFRAQAWVMSAVLALSGTLLALSYLHLNRLYDLSGIPACHASGDCGRLAASFVQQVNSNITESGPILFGIVATYVVPGIIGMFWGAPLVTRELEAGTLRLAWNQSVTRTRWLAAKLTFLGLAAMAASGLLTLIVTWSHSPILRAAGLVFTRDGSGTLYPFRPYLFATSGLVPLGYAAFAFTLGVTAGLLVRRTVPAMAVTLAVFTAVQVAWPLWVRPYLIPPLRSDTALNPALISGMTTGQNGFMRLYAGVDLPNAWVVSNQVVTPAGQLFSGPAPAAQNACFNGSLHACNVALDKLHLRQLVTYQPASRYWEFQWLETAAFLALALALAGLCLWWVRHRIT